MSSQVFANECPVEFGSEDYLVKVAEKIQAAESCEESATITEACAMGSSVDVHLASIATRRCTADFADKLTPFEEQNYSDLEKKCQDKYENMQGSMYLSFAAFCRLNLARVYSELFTPAE